jgi:prepilin-type N-terminal cleavage/methylation domain-containing protein
MLTRTRSAARRGFTLLELIVVIAILGILAAIAFVGYQTVLSNTSSTTQAAERKQVDNLFRAVSASTSTAPQTIADAATATAGPLTALGSDNAQFSFTQAADGDDVVVTVGAKTVGTYNPAAAVGAAGSWS